MTHCIELRKLVKKKKNKLIITTTNNRIILSLMILRAKMAKAEAYVPLQNNNKKFLVRSYLKMEFYVEKKEN